MCWYAKPWITLIEKAKMKVSGHHIVVPKLDGYGYRV